MSFIDELHDRMVQLLAEAERLVDWIEVNGPKVIHALADMHIGMLPPLPGFSNAVVQNLLARLREAVSVARQVISFLRWANEQLGSPDRLRAAAADLGEMLSSPATTLADGLVLGKLPSTLDANWHDDVASESYEHQVDGRDAAVRRIIGFSDGLALGLRSLADEIEDYFSPATSLLDNFIGVLFSLVMVIVGVATAETGVGAAIAAVGIIGVVVSVGAAAVQIWQMETSHDHTMEAIAGRMTPEIPAWPAVIR